MPSILPQAQRSLSAPDIRGCLDGFEVTYADRVIDTFPTWEGAVAGLRAARFGLAELDAVLAHPLTQPEA